MFACDYCLRPSDEPPVEGLCDACRANETTDDHDTVLDTMRAIGVVACDALDRLERAFWPMPDDDLSPMPSFMRTAYGE